MFAFAQHQQTRRTQPRIPPGMIDRQCWQTEQSQHQVINPESVTAISPPGSLSA
jgi:hypothetical protein